MRGNIRVFCRVRPFLEGEDPISYVEVPDESSVRLITPTAKWKSKNAQKEQDFEFEYVFGQNDGEQEVFNQLDQLI